MFKIYVHKANRFHKNELTCRYSAKSHVLAFGANALRAINDPASVYFEIDEDEGQFRVRSAILSDDPGKRIPQHMGNVNTPRLMITCREFLALLQKYCQKADAKGIFVFFGNVDHQTHSVVFDFRKAQRVS